MARQFSACPAFTAEAVRGVADDCRRSLDDCRHVSSVTTHDYRHASSVTTGDYRHASSTARNAPSTSTPRPFSRNAPPSAARLARTAPCVAWAP